MSTGKTEDGWISDPGLYRRLSEPVENVDTAKRRGEEFYKDLCALREKYHVPDMVVAFGINAKGEDGKEIFVTQVGYRGSSRCQRLILELTRTTRFGETLLALVDELALAAFIE